jgi:two-component system, NarL family, sensor kinase
LSEGSADRGLTERLRAERDERRRLAELIHDGPVQHVAAIAQMLDAAHHALVDGDDEIGRRIVARALEVAREASGDLREIVSGIEPDALRELGLAGAVRELAERLSARRGVQIELDVDAASALGEGAQSGLYQVVREALDQAVRRGPPSRISVSLRESADGMELRVSDDGAQERRQAVLDGLTQRAAELNGTFASETTDAGTWIAVRLPPSATHL